MAKDIDSLRRLQLVELDIMKQILQIIETYHLRYYMLGGTLLGAVRHKGFIPWDDDMDIGMPRPDYEKFLKIAESELRLPYQLHTLQNNNGEYAYYYARVENATVKLRRTLTEKAVIIPAWIDVFPLDGVPEDKYTFEAWKKKCDKYRFLLDLSQFKYIFNVNTTKRTSHQELIIFIKRIITGTRIYKLIKPEWAWKKLDQELKSIDYESSTRLINYCGVWRIKEMFPKSVYGEGRLYPFEDLMLMGPDNYDVVLKQMYGDYMTPPPVDARDHHHIELVCE